MNGLLVNLVMSTMVFTSGLWTVDIYSQTWYDCQLDNPKPCRDQMTAYYLQPLRSKTHTICSTFVSFCVRICLLVFFFLASVLFARFSFFHCTFGIVFVLMKKERINFQEFISNFKLYFARVWFYGNTIIKTNRLWIILWIIHFC